MWHVGEQVSVGGGFLLEELAKQELVWRRRVSHGLGLGPEFGWKGREIEGKRAREIESDTKHFMYLYEQCVAGDWNDAKWTFDEHYLLRLRLRLIF